MITLCVIPNLAKMSESSLVKCVFTCLAMDLVITLACINL